MKPVIGIRPIIDGRQGGIRESLEAQTMGMALAESVALPSPDRAGADMSQGASGTE